jgi:hypothetical protein
LATSSSISFFDRLSTSFEMFSVMDLLAIAALEDLLTGGSIGAIFTDARGGGW